MKKLSLLALTLAVLLSHASAMAAPACGYCDEMDKLMADFKKTPADPMNEATEKKQEELVERSSSLFKKILKANNGRPSDEDMIRFTKVMEKATEYDGQNDLGADVMVALGPQADEFFKTVRRLRDSKKISKDQANATIDAVAMAEQIRDHGSEEDAQ